MKHKEIFLGAGLFFGLAVAFILGANYDRVELTGEISIKSGNVGKFQPAFSGIGPDGDSYIAITNTSTGDTEIFGITEFIRKRVKDLPSGKQGSVILEVSMK